MDRILSIVLCLCLTFFNAPAWSSEVVSEVPSTLPSTLPYLSVAPSASSGPSPGSPIGLLVQMEGAEGEATPDPAEPPSLAEIELENRLRELRIRRSEVDLRPGRRAQLAGGIMLGVGALVVGLAAATCAAANSGNGTECRQDRATGLEIGGGVVAGIGLITLIAGFSNLGARNEEIREYDRRIKSLNRQRNQGAPKIDARLSLGEEKKLTLSWRF